MSNNFIKIIFKIIPFDLGSEILIAQYSIPFYLGGTSLLIVVVVGMDTVGQIQSHLFAYQYEALIKKSRLRGTRR